MQPGNVNVRTDEVIFRVHDALTFSRADDKLGVEGNQGRG